jgi:hypothetical protein
VPVELLEPIDSAHAPAFDPPLVPLWPAIDGGKGAEGWEGAGRVLVRALGTMHRGAGLVKEMLFGASASGSPLFLRFEPVSDTGAAALSGLTLRVELLVSGSAEPAAFDAVVAPGVAEVDGARLALGDSLEARLPLGIPHAGPLVFRARLLDQKGRVVEAIPPDGWLRFTPPGPASSAGSLLKARTRPSP